MISDSFFTDSSIICESSGKILFSTILKLDFFWSNPTNETYFYLGYLYYSMLELSEASIATRLYCYFELFNFDNTNDRLILTVECFFSIDFLLDLNIFYPFLERSSRSLSSKSKIFAVDTFFFSTDYFYFYLLLICFIFSVKSILRFRDFYPRSLLFFVEALSCF